MLNAKIYLNQFHFNIWNVFYIGIVTNIIPVLPIKQLNLNAKTVQQMKKSVDNFENAHIRNTKNFLEDFILLLMTNYECAINDNNDV